MSATAPLNDPQKLYEHWELQQWSPWDVDLADDQVDWRERLSDEAKGLVRWALSSLIVAEERIATKFAGLVMAGDDEEETTYLATQQVDEARHMQFYARFQNEVVAAPELIASHVARSREQLGDPFRVIFDESLVRAHDRLVASPRDRAAKVAFVTIYHLVIEATLGLTAFEFITRYLTEQRLLRGFVDGYTRIHGDEQRHIAYGVWFLRSAVEREPPLANTVRDTLRVLLPAAAAALAPPDGGDGNLEPLGAGDDEIREFASTGLSRRLKLIGVEL